MKVSDIHGASKKQTYQRHQVYDSFTYNDVYQKQWVSTRTVNPLEPSYVVRDEIKDGQFIRQGETCLNEKYGGIEKSKPQLLPPAVGGVRNLNTEDIKGAQHGTKTLGAFTHYKRVDPARALTSNEDISGTQSGSLKNCIQTIRTTNPLDPHYQIPGNKEKKSEINDPYGEAGCSVPRVRPMTAKPPRP